MRDHSYARQRQLVFARLRRAGGTLVLKKSSKLYPACEQMVNEGSLQRTSDDTKRTTYTLPPDKLITLKRG